MFLKIFLFELSIKEELKNSFTQFSKKYKSSLEFVFDNIFWILIFLILFEEKIILLISLFYLVFLEFSKTNFK